MSKAILVMIGDERCGVFYQPKVRGDEFEGEVLHTVLGDPAVAKARADGAVVIDVSPMHFLSVLLLRIMGPAPALCDEMLSEVKPGEGLDGCGYVNGDLAPIPVVAGLFAKFGAKVENLSADATVH